jgi:hypothetical protein
MEAESTIAASDDPIGEAVRTVAASLAEANQMLTDRADEMGIDLGDVMDDPYILEGIERRSSAVEGQKAVELAKKYADDSRHVLDASARWRSDHEDPLCDEMLEILHWYVFFIAAKLHRGFHGIFDLDGDEDWEALHDSQSDANGSIKIALIAIERSILAWTYLLTAQNAEVITPRIESLEQIKSLAEQQFPRARDFVRPGFDELETVM